MGQPSQTPRGGREADTTPVVLSPDGNPFPCGDFAWITVAYAGYGNMDTIEVPSATSVTETCVVSHQGVVIGGLQLTTPGPVGSPMAVPWYRNWNGPIDVTFCATVAWTMAAPGGGGSYDFGCSTRPT